MQCCGLIHMLTGEKQQKSLRFVFAVVGEGLCPLCLILINTCLGSRHRCERLIVYLCSVCVSCHVFLALSVSFTLWVQPLLDVVSQTDCRLMFSISATFTCLNGFMCIPHLHDRDPYNNPSVHCHLYAQVAICVFCVCVCLEINFVFPLLCCEKVHTWVSTHIKKKTHLVQVQTCNCLTL